MQVLSSVWTLYKFMLSKETSFIQAKKIKGPEDYSSSDESFCLQLKIQQSQAECKKIPTPSHLITNLADKLKPHQTRIQFLRARLDTCTVVNMMPASVYKLMFNDPELKKLATSTLEIGTCTTDSVKIVGSCLFYLVLPDTKKLQEVTFYVAQNDGSIFLSCTTILVLGPIQPHTRLDYLPLRASLITGSVDHPKKTKRVSVYSSRKEVSAQSIKQVVTVPKMVTSKEQIFQSYSDVFEGYWMLSGSPIPYTVRSKNYIQADNL